MFPYPEPIPYPIPINTVVELATFSVSSAGTWLFITIAAIGILSAIIVYRSKLQVNG